MIKNLTSTVTAFAGNIKIALTVYIFVTILISVVQFYNPHKQLQEGKYTSYNNYIIFKKSFSHLTEGKDLYIAYPGEHWDLFKYSPLFALSMGALVHLPDLLSLIIWNLANALVLFFAIKSLPHIAENKKSFIAWVILPELLINLQNSQSNALMAGFMIFAFSFFEKKKAIPAALMCVLAFSVKIYGGIAALLFLFYPQKPKFILSGLLYTATSIALPIIIIPAANFELIYESWINILLFDLDTSVGISVMGWLQTWFNFVPNKNIILIAGALLLLLPLAKTKEYGSVSFRHNYFATLLIWVIIFNHRSESPTFIIAFAGAALWYLNSAKTKIETSLFLLTFIFSSLSPTDLFPAFIRNNYVIPYTLKAVPYIFLWVYISYAFFFKSSK